MKKDKILAIVPARQGSKGVKLKNLRKIGGKSLIEIVARFIDVSKEIDLGILSTDSNDIAKEGEKFGLEVPFIRSKKLSGDFVGDIDIIHHALHQYHQSSEFDYTIMLQPTCPLRKQEHLKRCLQKIKKENLNSVWTVSRVDKKHHPFKQLISNNGELNYFSPEGHTIIARQQLNECFIRNGACYLWKTNYIKNTSKILPPKTGLVIVNDPIVNIDEEKDLEDAEKLFFKH